FQSAVDAVAMIDGSAGQDTYLASWEAGPFVDMPGAAREAARALAETYNTRFPIDIVGIVTELHRSGRRDAAPGAIDHLMGEQDSTQKAERPSRRNALLERLATGAVLIADGATGTYLQQRGLEPGAAPELLNATQPDLIRQMAADYYAAGSDL